MRRSILWLLWLVLPVFVLAYHYGPGQSWLARDHAATLIAKAESQATVATKAQAIAYETQCGLLDARRIAFSAGVDWRTQPEHPLARSVIAATADQDAAYEKAADAWQQTVDSYQKAIQSLLSVPEQANENLAEISTWDRRLLESLRWAEARAMVRSGEVFNGIEQLQNLLDLRIAVAQTRQRSAVRLSSSSRVGVESQGLPADSIREELAAAKYIGARLLREEGRPQEVWRPVANSARQHYRYLAAAGSTPKSINSSIMTTEPAEQIAPAEARVPSAKRPLSTGLSESLDRDQRLQRNLEQVLNLEQITSEELEGRPLPLNAPLARRPGDGKPGDGPGKPGIGKLRDGPPNQGAGIPGPMGVGW